jgi:NAD-dependent deacetylase
LSIDKLKNILAQSQNIVFFGGAGVSTESSIPDFRSEDGIYKTIKKFGYPPEVMLSHSFFVSHPEEFFDFYKNNMIFLDAKPNKAHIALSALEERGSLKAVITQNIDGLHQLAGSVNVFELHGSVHRNYCTGCGKKFDLSYIINSADTVPKCDKCTNIVRPDVTLYEEALDNDILSKAIEYIIKADTLIVGGTSLAVYPAAGLINYYKGSRLVLINKSSTAYDDRADLIIKEPIGQVLDKAVFH